MIYGMEGTEPEPLHQLDKEEWWDVMRRVMPDITREEYDRHWDEFQAMKARRGMN